jgi:hypothetical protein
MSKDVIKRAQARVRKAEKTIPLGEGGRFKAMESLMKAKGMSNPAGAAAAIGRRKLGAARFNALAAKGRKEHSK